MVACRMEATHNLGKFRGQILKALLCKMVCVHVVEAYRYQLILCFLAWCGERGDEELPFGPPCSCCPCTVPNSAGPFWLLCSKRVNDFCSPKSGLLVSCNESAAGHRCSPCKQLQRFTDRVCQGQSRSLSLKVALLTTKTSRPKEALLKEAAGQVGIWPEAQGFVALRCSGSADGRAITDSVRTTERQQS